MVILNDYKGEYKELYCHVKRKKEKARCITNDIPGIVVPYHRSQAKIVATEKEVGVQPPEAPRWPNSSSGGCANYVPGDVKASPNTEHHRKRVIEVGVPPPKNDCHRKYKDVFPGNEK